MEARNKHGDLYPARTSAKICADIFRYLKHDLGRPDLNFLSSLNMVFTKARKVLDTQMRIVTNEGIGTVRKRADPITQDQETHLRERKILGYHSSLVLSRTVYYYNCKSLTCGQEMNIKVFRLNSMN
jgi:hypothetical protein